MTPTFAQPPYGVASLADRDSHKPAQSGHWRMTMHRAKDALITAQQAVRKLAEKCAESDSVTPITDESIRRNLELYELRIRAQGALKDAEILWKLCRESTGDAEGALCRAVESAAGKAWDAWKSSDLG